jgi:two-component system cell cycle response regulator DivK
VDGFPRILIVDDFDDNRQMYATFMTLAGFDVAEAATGPEGLAMAGRLLPDLIVMDLSLPGLDGWEVTRRLKADPLTKHIPVLALTSHSLDRYMELARAAGCDGFITKPCLPDDLVKEIRRLLAQTLDERPAQ